MPDAFDRLGSVRQPPLWVYPLSTVAAVLAFVTVLPFGLDPLPDVVIEGLYFAFAALVLLPIRQADIGVLEYGWLLFVFGRLVDFLDELFVEPEPLVEPYFSGLLMVVSLGLTVAGATALIQKRDEELATLELRTEELTLKNKAMDEAPVGITIADMTDPDEPLTYINEGFNEMTGYDVEATIGSNCRFLQGAQTDSDRVSRMRTAIENDEPVQVTIRNYRKDGTEFWNEITLAPLRDSDGEVTNYVGFQQDVTERKEYERRVEEQRDELDLLSQMVRHDIRNDLQVVAGRLDLLADHVDSEGEQFLETADESIRDAVSLTETARDLANSVLEDDSEQRPMSLRASLGGEIEAARAADDRATFTVDEPLPDVAVLSDALLDSVFRNVLTNAVKHNDSDEPTVSVSVDTATDGFVTVSIADDGPGVPDDLKDEIFGRGTKGLESDGTGIGMYLVDTLVARYGGKVWVEDNEPRGSVFKLRLPTAETA